MSTKIQRFAAALATERSSYLDNPESLLRDDLGDWVRFTDYLETNTQLDELKAVLREIVDKHTEYENSKDIEEALILSYSLDDAIKSSGSLLKRWEEIES